MIAITNVVGSTASRVADQTIYTRAGPEISVAATKTFIAQLIALYWLALPYARVDSQEAGRPGPGAQAAAGQGPAGPG